MSIRPLLPLEDRGPLRVMFLLTSMPVGGAETLLVNLIRRMDRERLLPQVCCLKDRGPLGEMLADEVPVHAGLLAGKFDVQVLPRLARLLRRQRIDAVVTVGAGDKMFWGRLAAKLADVPVIASALHSTGWPDGVGRLNRWLTPLTDAFIAVAEAHGRHLIERERFPAARVHVIPNGVDTDAFRQLPPSESLRRELNIPPGAPVAGIVAALRPEKNHELLLRAMQRVRCEFERAHLLIVGDGPRRGELESLTRDLGLNEQVRFLGTRSDVPDILSLVDVFVLTSHNEANPVSILEAMACGKPVVAPRVGSIPESVRDGQTGYLVPPGDGEAVAERIGELFRRPEVARRFGRLGREAVVAQWSLERMVQGYEDLLAGVYSRKCRRTRRPTKTAVKVSTASHASTKRR